VGERSVRLFLAASALAAVLLSPPAPADGREVTVHFFWGEGCPYCEAEEAFLADLKGRYPELRVESHEVWNNRENALLYGRVLKVFGAETARVPGTLVGRRLWIGFSAGTGLKIEEEIKRCIREGCGGIDEVLASGAAARPAPEAPGLSLPLVGRLDPGRYSLPALAVILGALDGFNPCAFFVLFFLLSLLVHARSRRRMALIGGTFVLFSGLVYFLFMAAWLNLFMLAGRVAAITSAAGAVAVVIAAVNIKDFFAFKKGVSLTISEGSMKKLFHRMRGLLSSASLPSMMAGTAALALAANLYELLCTAGFPMVFTRALTLRGLATWQYYGYLALYNLVYVVPLAAIVAAFVVTLGSRKLTEWQGRQLKLVSGLMMLFLGLVLVFEPSLLDNALAAVAMLAAALSVSAIIIAVARKREAGLGRA